MLPSSPDSPKSLAELIRLQESRAAEIKRMVDDFVNVLEVPSHLEMDHRFEVLEAERAGREYDALIEAEEREKKEAKILSKRLKLFPDDLKTRLTQVPKSNALDRVKALLNRK